MAAIKDLQKIGSKWTTVTPARTQDYVEGVQNPKKSWQTATKAAEGNWKQGVQAAATRGAFGKGVAASGDQAWKDGVTMKGQSRWGQGVQQSADKYQAGFAPYHQAISSVNLPPRGPRRDPRNLERVKAVVDAMVKVKEARG